ncbi:alpha/beta hydrolase [Microbacterium deminutum]|uniref:AB hydrolase-1 domain-containing protein n=1 Tax=Microbacterium deminutum TaxID=344164 RepID=A0ABP5BGT1_9MICO
MTTVTPLTATPTPEDEIGSTRSTPVRRRHVGPIAVGSLVVGLAAALVLAAVPFGPATQSAVTGSVLCGFAFGWALLAILSVRFTDRPQRWAYAPALLMGVGGLLLVAFGPSLQQVLNWIWPPVMLGLSIWMLVRVHHGLRDSRSRWVLYPVAGLLALTAVGGGYQTIGEAADAQANPMPGRLVEIGDHGLHVYCAGSGSPTVVLEAGGGAKASDLALISTRVAADTRVCVYDRAGRGWSESAPTPPHGIQIATDLHTLLQRAGVPGPYVLAGHSFGGLYVQTFAARYPSEVAGMVLIDSTAPNPAAAPYTARPFVVDRVFALVSTVAQLGLGHLFGATPRDLLSTIDEYADASDAVRQAASLTDLGDMPLIVLTAGSGHDAAWTVAQDQMATLSTDTVHRIVEGATHEALVADPNGAAATAHAIAEVVSSVRTGESVNR